MFWANNLMTIAQKYRELSVVHYSVRFTKAPLMFFNGPTPASFWFIFGLFKQALQFLQKINVKNVHPVFSARNQTHDLWNMSLFPKPLDQGSHPTLT